MSNNGNKQKFEKPSVEEVKKPVENQNKETEKKTEEVVKETPKSEPVKTEEKKDVKPTTPAVEKNEAKVDIQVKTPEVNQDKTNVTEIKVGQKVMLKSETNATVTGQPIPTFAYKNTYVVDKVLPSRVIIKAGTTLSFAVKKEDLVLI